MATGTARIGAMQFERLSQRQVFMILLRGLQGGDVGGRWWRRVAEQIFQDPLAAFNRAGVGRIGSERQHGGLSQNALAAGG